MNDENAEFVARAQGRVGTWLRGKYRLERVLGVGGMAVVFKATHRNNAEFAIKMLHPELSMREEVRLRFLREGYAANTVKHPSVVIVVDDDVTEDGAAFLVMELLRGKGCEVLWEAAALRMNPKAAFAIGWQVLDVLAAAHDNGIIHRDIKPANLFVTSEGRVKVLDFGIARVKDVATSGANATATGMLLGTPAFMPPEQALGKSSEIDGRTDVWAVGATIFSLITGKLVHAGDNPQQVLVAAATKAAPPLTSIAPAVPQGLASIVDMALAFDRDARFASAAAMRDALGDAYRECFGALPSTSILVDLLHPERQSAAPAAPEVSVLSTMPLLARPYQRTPNATMRTPAPPPEKLEVSTAQPVVASAPALTGSRTPRWLLPVIAAALITGGSVFAFMRRTNPTTDVVAAQHAPVLLTQDPPPAPPSAHSVVTVLPSAAPSAVPSAVLPSIKALPPITSAGSKPSAHSAATTLAPSASAHAPSCHLVESVDAQGQHHFQNVCP